KGDFAHARTRQSLCLSDHRFKSPGTEFAAQLRDDAKAAGMIAAFRNLDVSRGTRSGQHTRRTLVIQIIWQIGNSPVPCFTREAALRGASIAFRSRGENPEW